jgi:four helix bundle protein
MGEFRTLLAWQKGMDLVDAVYDAVELPSFPEWELHGLSKQLRTAARSIPANLAEGKGRYTIRDQQHFYRQARGSSYELETHIEIAKRRKFIPVETATDLLKRAAEVGRLINGLLKSLKAKAGAERLFLRPDA